MLVDLNLLYMLRCTAWLWMAINKYFLLLVSC
uniref:Uncharacterized protein n=1 Tax=Anguilla anguilla TaxID=7936 RepID=A0A0E9U992_ANGAN